jgi:hypothetical protein
MKKIKAKFNLPGGSEVIAMDEGTSASFVADPICTSLPYINANGFAFTKEGLQKKSVTMSRKPLNFMHEQKNIVGHVEKSGFSYDNEGRVTAFASGAMYRRIFPDLVEKMTKKDGFGMFKVSVEAGFEDFSWYLHEKTEENMLGANAELLHAGTDDELDDMGMFCMWLFGTVRGLKHRGKDVALVIGGESESCVFIGLAVTDELAGSAADQNTRISVLASEGMKATAARLRSSTITDDEITPFVMAMVSGSAEDVSSFGLTLEDRNELIESFVEECDELISVSSALRSDAAAEASEVAVVSEIPVEELLEELASEQISEVVSKTTDEVTEAMERQDKITRGYVRKIDNLILASRRKDKKLKKLEAEVAKEKENTAVKMEFAVAEVGCLNDKIEEMSNELLALRKFELASMDASDLASNFEEDIKKMSTSAYADFKKKFLGTSRPAPAKVNFEEQTKRALRS